MILGYYSNVAIVIDAKDNDKLSEAAKDWDKKYNLDGNYTVEHLINKAYKDVTTKDKKYRLIVWDSIKWYSDISPEKIFVSQKFFGSLDEYDIPYDFVRIGEEMGDYDAFGDLDSGVVYPDQKMWFNEDLLGDNLCNLCGSCS